MASVCSQGGQAASEFKTDWPSYLGANDAFSETSGVRLVNDMCKVRLLWESEEKGIGFGKGGSQACKVGFAPGTGLAYGGEASPIVAGGMVIQFYTTPSGEKSWSDGPANMGEKYKEFANFYKISADEIVVAMDAATGKTKWKRTFAGKGLNMVPAKRGGFATTPCASVSPPSSLDGTTARQGKVFCMGTTGRLYALDLATGKVAWESNIGPVHDAMEAFKAESLKTLARTNPPCRRPYGMLAVVYPADGGTGGVLLAPDWGGGLVGVETATGKRLWQTPNVVSGFNGPVVAGERIACVNAAGELRLLNPRTGAVLWTQPLGSLHLTQPVLGDELLLVFEAHPKFGNKCGSLAAYRLSEKGATKVWGLPVEYFQHLALDGGPARKVVARQGIVYASLLKAEGGGTDPGDATAQLVIVREKDGQILGAHEVDGWNPYLWGDRLITVTDIQHRPRGVRPEVWQMYNADPANFRALGDGWLVDGPPPVHNGTCGYELPILEVFADGVFFCRVWGGIRAYDLRALTPEDNSLAATPPKVDLDTATWELTLKNFFDKHRPLDMILHRKDGQWVDYRVTGMKYNIAWHQADLSGLTVTNGQIAGPVVITVRPDRWIPADRKTNVVDVTIQATVTGRTVTGSYTGTLGGEGTGVVGRVRNLTKKDGKE
jgi:outer membrane protein assembly factor BamB